MTYRFKPETGLVLASVRITGPSGEAVANMAVDTGATSTLVRDAILVSIGFDPAASTDRTSITTGSGIAFVPRVVVSRLEALGRTVNGFPLLAHTLPAGTGVDGLLGLDFLRGRRLVVDFRKGTISLS